MTGKRNTTAKKNKVAEQVEEPRTTAASIMEGAPDFALMRLFSLCREYGVLRFEGSIPGTPNLVKFDLAPALASDPQPVRASTPREPAAQPQAAVKGSTKKVGSDGLTAEQQDELYARPMDAKG